MMRSKFIRCLPITLTLVVGLLLTGCEKKLESQALSGPMNSMQSQEAEGAQSVGTNTSAADLEEQLAIYKSYLNDAYYLQEVAEQEPEVARLTTPQEWESVKVYRTETGDEYVIKDEELLRQVASLLVLLGHPRTDTHASTTAIEPFSLLLTDREGKTVAMEVIGAERVTLSKSQLGAFRVSPDLAQLGIAFLPNPSTFPKELFESRLISSGMLKVQEGNYSYSTFQQFRIWRTAKEFLTAEKTTVEAPEVKAEDAMLILSYWLYGEVIKLEVYEHFIRTLDDETSQWYKIDPQIATQMRAMLAAS